MYKTAESFFLLSVVPDDMENQLSMTLAREADPSGKRTIGKLLLVQCD